MDGTRYARGVVIAAGKHLYKIPQSVLWKVESSKPGKYYDVITRADGLTCTCFDFEHRHNICKHCYAVLVTMGGHK